MTIRVGTSGWGYDEWDGVVYPRLAAERRLKWYAEQLPIVEIDSTYYGDPTPSTVQSWIDKVSSIPRFEFSVKAPKRLTHEQLVDGAADRVAEIAREWATLVPAPLAAAGRLGAVLLQLSPYVRRDDATLERLRVALAELRAFAVAVEFRHSSWLEDARLARDARALLDAHDAAAVSVDGPPFPALLEGRASHAYVRFHGRNAASWWGHDEDTPRYQHHYSESELQPWAVALRDLAEERNVRVFFNNHPGGHAFHDARAFEALLAAEGARIEKATSPQRKLF